MHRNHHLSKPVMIGEVQADGQFNIVWRTQGPIVAENWSPFIPENANRRR
jgi:urea transport system substrate-binding protein